jgi:hypothetical protein
MPWSWSGAPTQVWQFLHYPEKSPEPVILQAGHHGAILGGLITCRLRLKAIGLN